MDNTNKKIHITEHTEIEIMEETFSGSKIEHYIINGMQYTKITNTAGVSEPWEKYAIPADDFESLWEGKDEVYKQIRFLESSGIESLGSEQVNGVECQVVEVIPSIPSLVQLLGVGGIITDTESTEVIEPEEYMKDLSAKQWFAKDTYFLMRAEFEWTVQVYESFSLFEQKKIECSHYNEPVSIELPPEAKEAEEVE